MPGFLWVFIGGGVGATLRFGLSRLALTYFSKTWSGTLVVNLLGCAIFYFLTRLGMAEDKSGQLLIKVGLLGSLTTFSTFSFEVLTLFKQGNWREGALVILLNVFFGIIIGIGILR
jgi:CrcB protein